MLDARDASDSPRVLDFSSCVGEHADSKGTLFNFEDISDSDNRFKRRQGYTRLRWAYWKSKSVCVLYYKAESVELSSHQRRKRPKHHEMKL